MVLPDEAVIPPAPSAGTLLDASWESGWPMLGVVISIFALTAGLHLCLSWGDMFSFIWRLLHPMEGMGRASGFSEPRELEKEQRVQEQMDSLRVQLAFFAAMVGSHLCAGAAVIACVWLLCCQNAPTTPKTAVLAAAVVLLSAWVVAMAVKQRYVKLTRRRVTRVYLAVSAIFLLRLWGGFTDTEGFYVLQNARFLIRAFLGFFVLNIRLSACVNIAWAAPVIYSVWGLADSYTVLFITLEVWNTFVLILFLWFAEVFAESHFRLNVGMMKSTDIEKAVRRLLSVLCDAEVFLSPGLEIQDPSPKAAHLLAPHMAASELQGRCFSDFVTSADRERFRAFLSSSAGGAAPPASMHLTFSSGSGSSFPVEVFHVNLAYSQCDRLPDHLIGLRACAPSEPSAGPASAQGECAVEMPKKPAPELYQSVPCKGRAGRPADDAASSSSASSAPTVHHGFALPALLGVDVDFDAAAQGMPVQQVRLVFSGKTKQAPPVLRDWVHAAAWERLQGQVQGSLNGIVNGRDEGKCELGPLFLQWPSSGQEFLLEAKRCTLALADSDCESGSEGGEEEREEQEAASPGSDGGSEGDSRDEQFSGEEDDVKEALGSGNEGDGKPQDESTRAPQTEEAPPEEEEGLIATLRLQSFRQLVVHPAGRARSKRGGHHAGLRRLPSISEGRRSKRAA